MTALVGVDERNRFARCIAASKRVRWDTEADVIRGRKFSVGEKFLPDGLSLIDRLTFLTADQKCFLSQVQGRTYANVFGLVERFINAKILELSRDHWMGDQVALEALVRFSDEELKHQALFRRIEHLAADVMPDGYRFAPDPNDVANAVLGKSSWAVLLLTLHIELFTQQHYQESMAADHRLSVLYKDVFRFHWVEESQHARIDEMELRRIDADLSEEERDHAIEEFIELVGAVDQVLQLQAAEDARYFLRVAGEGLTEADAQVLEGGVLRAYRWQYILSGAQHPHFQKVLSSLIAPHQLETIAAALRQLS